MNLDDLEKLTLETLITRHRDRFDLRYSNEEDLSWLLCVTSDPADGRVVKNTFKSWLFITLEDCQQDHSQVILTGVADGGYYSTSPVVHYNRDQGWVFTRSGSLYILNGPASEVPADLSRVLFIAALFNYWGIGPVLGIPPAFF